MARIRTIKPTMWDSEKLGRCSALARLNFVGLISLADDDGRGRGETRFLVGHLHPYAKDVSESAFEKANAELEKTRLVAFYTVDDCRYYAIPGWAKHQYIEKPKPSELPKVSESHPMRPLFFPSDSPPRPLSVPVGREGNGMDGNGCKTRQLPTGGDKPVDNNRKGPTSFTSCSYTEKGRHVCSQPKEERSDYCRDHKIKVAEMYHDKKNTRGGGLTKAGDAMKSMKLPRRDA